MHTPEPSEEWLRRLVEELNRTAPGGWAALVRRHADPADRLAGVLETAALLAAEKAGGLTGAEAAAWRAVVDGLAAEHPEHADAVRECAGLLTAVAGGRRAPAPAGARQLRPGDRLGPFVVTRFVAGGGMGEVYAAAQDGLDRTVALKVVRAGTAGPLARARFERERLVLARLHQSNIVPVYFAGGDDDLQYYAMQYVPGAPLNRVVTAVYQRATTAAPTAQTPPLSELVDSLLKATPVPSKPDPSDATQVATQSGPAWRTPDPPAGPVRLSAGYFRSVAAALAQVADAIHHGHETGVLHRDIKPSNLILDARGVCMVIDYGLARACGAAPLGPPDDPVEDALTRGGVGTPQYMAPEQFAGHADARSDVWGLGATLYELLTLRPAFAPARWSELEKQVRAEHPPAADAVVRTVPRDLAAVCAKAMAKDAADRYPTAAAFAADLRRWLGWHPTAARPGWGTLRPLRLWACRHKGAAAAAALSVVSVVASAGAVTERANTKAADARAEAAEEKGKRTVAEAEVERQKRAREFAAALASAEELRRQRPFAGWSGAVRAKLDAARTISPDIPLADAYSATLTGPDARRLKRYSHPEQNGPPTAGFGSVAFGPDGRLACGGFYATRGAVLDLARDGDPTFTTRDGMGPVAWADANTPLQLCYPRGAPTLVLWHLTENRAVAELPLPERSILPLVATLSADGRRAAFTVGRMGRWGNSLPATTVVWDVDPTANGAAPVERARWDGPASALAFSPDGRFLAAGTDDGTVTVRDLTTKAGVMTRSAGRLRVTSLAFGRTFRADATGRAPAGPAGEYLLAAGSGSGVLVWDLGSGERVSNCRGASHKVNGLAFTPDGAALVTVGHHVPLVWDVASGLPVFELSGDVDQWGDAHHSSVAVSADGRRVAVAATNLLRTQARLQVYEFEADRGVGVYRGLTGVCQQTWLSPSAGLVAGLSDEWQLAVWERDTGRLRRVWDVPQGWETDNADVAFDEPAGRVYFAAGKAACQLNLATGAREQVWPLTKGLNDNLLLRPNRPPVLIRRELTAPDTDRITRPMTLRGRELLPDGTTRDTFPGIPGGNENVHKMHLTGGGRYLMMVLHGDKPAHMNRLLDVATGRPVAVRPPPGVALAEIIRVASDGTRLFADGSVNGGPRGLLQFRFPEMTVQRSDPGFQVWGLSVDDTGATGITFTEPGGRPGMFVMRVGQTQPVAVLDPGHAPVTYRLSPDGRFASWGREDGSVRVADLPRALERLAALTGR